RSATGANQRTLCARRGLGHSAYGMERPNHRDHRACGVCLVAYWRTLMLALPATNADVLAEVIAPALSVRGIIQRSGQARQRQPRPHHSRTCKEVAAMANANSIRAVARSSNGTPLYECVCPDCGAVRIQDKRKIGRPCHTCAVKRRVTHGLSNH